MFSSAVIQLLKNRDDIPLLIALTPRGVRHLRAQRDGRIDLGLSNFSKLALKQIAGGVVDLVQFRSFDDQALGVVELIGKVSLHRFMDQLQCPSVTLFIRSHDYP
jgi:hypothetical protein